MCQNHLAAHVTHLATNSCNESNSFPLVNSKYCGLHKFRQTHILVRGFLVQRHFSRKKDRRDSEGPDRYQRESFGVTLLFPRLLSRTSWANSAKFQVSVGSVGEMRLLYRQFGNKARSRRLSGWRFPCFVWRVRLLQHLLMYSSGLWKCFDSELTLRASQDAHRSMPMLVRRPVPTRDLHGRRNCNAAV